MFRAKSRESTVSKASKISKKDLKMQEARDPQSGRPGHLDPGQEHLLKKFRQEVCCLRWLYFLPDLPSSRLKEKAFTIRRDTTKHAVSGFVYLTPYLTQCIVCRFLRARKWNLEATLAMFEAAETWRKEFKVDDLYAHFEYPEKEEVDKYYPQYYHRTDRVGSGTLLCFAEC